MITILLYYYYYYYFFLKEANTHNVIQASARNCFSGRVEPGGDEECFAAFILGSAVPQRELWAALAAKKPRNGDQNLFWQRSTARPLEESSARRIGSLRACFGLRVTCGPPQSSQ